jgi:hypothetical protein
MTDIDKTKAKRRNWSSFLRGLSIVEFPCFQRRYGFGRTIAICIDDYSIKLAAAQRFGHITRLLSAIKIYIPSSYDDPTRRQDFITAEIGRFIREYRRPLTKIILGVGGQESAVRVLTLPQMSNKELGRAVYWEGKKQIPFGLDEAFYGHYVIPNSGFGANKNISASIIAVSKKEIFHRLGQLHTNFKVDAIHHELEALGHLLRNVDGFSVEKTYMLINIKKDRSEVSFFRGDKLIFIHISSLGSGTLPHGKFNDGNFDSFTENLVLEIQNSLDYYVGRFSQASTETVFVYGDLSYSDDLISHLTDRFGLEFRRFPLEKWLKSQPQAKDFADQIPVSLSAMALAVNNYPLINFLPPNLKEEKAVTRYYRWAVPAMILIISALLMTWTALKFEVNADRNNLAAAQNEIESFRRSHSFLAYSRIKQQTAANRILLEKMAKAQTYLNLNLKELSLLTPASINLENYELQNDGDTNSLMLTGWVFSTTAPPEMVLAEYIARLEGSPFYDNIMLKKHVKSSRNSGFVLDFTLEMNAII